MYYFQLLHRKPLIILYLIRSNVCTQIKHAFLSTFSCINLFSSSGGKFVSTVGNVLFFAGRNCLSTVFGIYLWHGNNLSWNACRVISIYSDMLSMGLKDVGHIRYLTKKSIRFLPLLCLLYRQMLMVSCHIVIRSEPLPVWSWQPVILQDKVRDLVRVCLKTT